MTQHRAVHGVHATGVMIKHSAVLSLVLNQGHRYQLRHLSLVRCQCLTGVDHYHAIKG